MKLITTVIISYREAKTYHFLYYFQLLKWSGGEYSAELQANTSHKVLARSIHMISSISSAAVIYYAFETENVKIVDQDILHSFFRYFDLKEVQKMCIVHYV